MIGSGLKTLAKEHGMQIAGGVAYGEMHGYAATLSEGAGYKRVAVTAYFESDAQRQALMGAFGQRDLMKEFRVQHFEVRDNVIDLVFWDNPGTMKKLRAFLDVFFPELVRSGAKGMQYCSCCGLEMMGNGEWRLIDGIAHRMHGSCATRTEGEMDAAYEDEQQSPDTSYASGFLGALIGALIGSVAWAVIFTMGFVSAWIGFLIGWLAEKGYTRMRGKRGPGKVVILVLVTLIGVVLGTLGGEMASLAVMIAGGELPGWGFGDLPMMTYILMQDPEVMKVFLTNIGQGVLFALLGIAVILYRTGKQVTKTKVKKLQ